MAAAAVLPGARRLLRTVVPALARYDAIIGLCGGIASGKSHAREVLASLGAVCIDADRLGHTAYRRGTACYNRVVSEFGPDVVAADGEIDRGKLGTVVFASAAALERLNGIMWPAVKAAAVEQLVSAAAPAAAASVPSAAAGSRAPLVAVVEAALLIEARWHEEVCGCVRTAARLTSAIARRRYHACFCTHLPQMDEVWVTYVDEATAVRRLRDRNGLTGEDRV